VLFTDPTKVVTLDAANVEVKLFALTEMADCCARLKLAEVIQGVTEVKFGPFAIEKVWETLEPPLLIATMTSVPLGVS